MVEWAWASMENIETRRSDAPETFTSWFFLAFDRVRELTKSLGQVP